jgi:hypothetical protein
MAFFSFDDVHIDDEIINLLIIDCRTDSYKHHKLVLLYFNKGQKDAFSDFARFQVLNGLLRRADVR